MKKQYGRFFALLMLSLVLAACSNEEDMVIPVESSYPDPQENLEAFQEQLMSAQNGWEGLLSPQPGKTYRVFFELSTTGDVSMYADADTIAAKTPTQTKYQIRLSQNVNASLIFEEGSNLDRIPGGKNAGVDIEYTYKYTRGDTLHLLGNKYGDALTLVKATPNNQDQYEIKKLKSNVKDISAYLKSVRYLYIQPEPDKLIQFMTNPISRGVYVTYLNNGAKFFGSDYAYSLDGIVLKNRLNTPGFGAQEILWDDVQKKLYTFYNGVRMDLQTSPIPVIPLHYLLGSEYPPGAAFPSPYAGHLPGWSPKFQTLWLIDDDALWDNYKISLYYVVTDLHVENNTMELYVYYVNASDVYVRGKFPYAFTKTEDGVFTFTPLPIDDSEEGQNAQVIAGHMPNIMGAINDNHFRIEFYDAFEELGGVIPQYISVDDSDLYFTGFFY